MDNLEKLTDKIYQEGVARAKKESEEIISKANAESLQLVEEAQKEADGIIKAARQEADKIKRSIENELQLKSRQLVSDLQNEVYSLLSTKVLNGTTSELFADEAFLKSAILEVIRCWKPGDDLEIIMPEELKKQLDESFHNSIKMHLTNLKLTFNSQLKDGFRIVEKAQGFHISFSKDEFVQFFESYLSDKARQLLFADRS